MQNIWLREKGVARSQLQNWVAFAVSVFIFLVVAHASAQEAGLLAGAKAEGRVVWYAGSGVILTRAIADAFEKKYPFIKVEVTRASDPVMLNRITTEKLAGKVLFDVVNSQILPLMYRLNVIGTHTPPGVEVMDAKYRDANGRWSGLHVDYYVLSYNTKLVRQQSPTDWWDLLNPRWKREIGIDPGRFHWLGAMMEYFGQDMAEKLMTGLARQEIQWHTGHTRLAHLTAAGELSVSLAYGHRIEEMKSKGAPIDWVRTTRPIVAGLQKVGLSSTPPHPNAGKLLVNFLISKEGQTVLYKQGYIPAFPGVLPKGSPFDPATLDVHPISPKVNFDLERYVKKFDQIFGPRR
ncbi:MAG: extracellular solute-binding protein [Deltaproteobacteria bacterium]|nr:extracellular solute-binding protein [Deltaproteobacteria bacterium]